MPKNEEEIAKEKQQIDSLPVYLKVVTRDEYTRQDIVSITLIGLRKYFQDGSEVIMNIYPFRQWILDQIDKHSLEPSKMFKAAPNSEIKFEF